MDKRKCSGCGKSKFCGSKNVMLGIKVECEYCGRNWLDSLLKELLIKEIGDVIGYVNNSGSLILIGLHGTQVTFENLEKVSKFLGTKDLNFVSTVDEGYYGDIDHTATIECSNVDFAVLKEKLKLLK
jgi:hypothetical protein